MEIVYHWFPTGTCLSAPDRMGLEPGEPSRFTAFCGQYVTAYWGPHQQAQGQRRRLKHLGRVREVVGPTGTTCPKCRALCANQEVAMGTRTERLGDRAKRLADFFEVTARPRAAQFCRAMTRHVLAGGDASFLVSGVTFFHLDEQNEVREDVWR